ncbi:MAG TPA: MFS transporter [Terriglobia bacterium]|nr:MFS transporter [Terriglobia bacterium]
MEIPAQRWRHILPVAFIMYTIAFVDRTNISLALPSMSRDLHMNSTQAGSAAGVFFWGYMALQIPGGYLAEHWSAKRFISILLVLWGLAAMVCGLVRTGQEFWVMRLVLGIAEGGVWPATLVLLAHWFPRSERARANAYWMLCLPAAVVVSSPVSGCILGRWGWRVMLISEGVLPFIWLVIWLLLIDNHPKDAKWISSDEQNYLEKTLRRESRELAPADSAGFLRTLLCPQVLLMVLIYFLLNSGNYGFLFWLPSALHSEKHLTDFVTGILFAIPFVVTGAGMVLISRHSDRRRERRGHVAGSMAWAGVFLLGGVLLSQHSFLLSFLCITVVGVGAFGALGPFWAIPSETLPRSVSGSAMGLINALGCLGGYFGPLLVGYLDNLTGNFVYGFAALGAGFILAAGLTLLLPSRKVAADAGNPA